MADDLAAQIVASSRTADDILRNRDPYENDEFMVVRHLAESTSALNTDGQCVLSARYEAYEDGTVVRGCKAWAQLLFEGWRCIPHVESVSRGYLPAVSEVSAEGEKTKNDTISKIQDGYLVGRRMGTGAFTPKVPFVIRRRPVGPTSTTS
eukprot:686720-Pyramimonas_sp.AAC.1